MRYILTVLLCLLPVTVWADGNHSSSALMITVVEATAQDDVIEIELFLRNQTDAPVTLLSMETSVASQMNGLDLPRTFTPGEFLLLTGQDALRLTPRGNTPGIFTMITDFGPDGMGRVIVLLD